MADAPDTPETVPVEIFSRWDRTRVLFRADVDASVPIFGRIRAALKIAVMTDANLTRADLTGADLTDANLTGANLTGANLTDADLTRADLTDANLTGANLTDANLTRADLTGADLTRANLTGANLTGANLTGANLTDADLTGIRNDLWDVLLRSRAEVPGLLAALREGRVDGTSYSGPCACLIGTIANIRGVSADTIDYRNPHRAIERWFLAICKGCTPETSAVAKVTEAWIIEFMALTAPESSQVSA